MVAPGWRVERAKLNQDPRTIASLPIYTRAHRHSDNVPCLFPFFQHSRRPFANLLMTFAVCLRGFLAV